MHRPRTTHRAGLRRPAAAAALLALLTTLVPAGWAAAGGSGVVPRNGATEQAGATVTYDYTCENPGNFVPTWALLAGYNQVGQAVMMWEADTADGYSQGSFSVTYPANASGPYTVRVSCADIVDHTFTIASLTTTTTTLVQQQSVITRGESATLTAHVWPLTEGSVEFSAGGTVVATVPLDDRGLAVAVLQPTETTTYTARFTGSATAQASPASSPVTVEVVSHVTAPQSVGIVGTPAVGTPLGVAPGVWQPSDTQLAYSWTVAGDEVSTDPTYVPVVADLGKEIRVAVTGSRSPLTPATLTSPAGVTVGYGSVGAGTVLLEGTADGEAVLGRPLTARPVGFGSDASFAYVWTVDGEPVGDTDDSFTPRAVDLGKPIHVLVTVTAPGKAPADHGAWARPAIVTPDVAVGSPTTTVGREAVVPVTVTGPHGAGVPAGTVTVTVTPRDGSAARTLDPVVLDRTGAAAVTVTGLPVGTFTTAVAYAPVPSARPAFARTAVDLSRNPYDPATGAGTITVTQVTPAVTLPATLGVPVATPAVLEATVAGSRLPATYVVREGTTVLAEGALGASGVLSVTLPVLAPGTHTLVLDLPATADTVATTRTVALTVGGEPARTGAVPTAQLDTPKAATAPGQRMELVAEGFQPGETVAFYLHSDPVFLGTAVADAQGVARLLADIPADAPAGAHTVVATGGTSGRWATLAVNLAVPAADRPELAATGASGGAAAAGAWVLLLVGGALVVLARRARIAR